MQLKFTPHKEHPGNGYVWQCQHAAARSCFGMQILKLNAWEEIKTSSWNLTLIPNFLNPSCSHFILEGGEWMFGVSVKKTQ